MKTSLKALQCHVSYTVGFFLKKSWWILSLHCAHVPSSKENMLKGFSSCYMRERYFMDKAAPATTNQERMSLKNICKLCSSFCQIDCNADRKTGLPHSTSDHYRGGAWLQIWWVDTVLQAELLNNYITW